MYGVVIFFLWGCGSPKIHRTFLSTLNMGMSHRHTDRVVSFFVCLGCVGGGGGGGISSLKQILHTHYKYHTDTLRLNCWKVFFFL